MDYKRILTIQDISCVGQCSLTVALPILSACGHETAILPAAVLSNHTVGFSGFTCHDLSDDMPKINKQWQAEGITFSAAYTGYLGSKNQIAYVLNIFDTCLDKDSVKIIDPAMADCGKLYPAFNMDFVAAMRRLVAVADITMPNITEAALLTGMEYKENYDETYINALVKKLHAIGANNVVITGVSYNDSTTGIIVSNGTSFDYVTHEKLPVTCHGTGDVFASSYVGAFMSGKDLKESARIAGNYTLDCIKNTIGDKDHWYGVKFEPLLENLIEAIK